MGWCTRRAVPLAPMVAAVGVVLSGVGAAPAAASTVVPLSNQIRACDFVKHLFVGGMGAGGGSGLADIGTQGSEVRAVVSLQSARPDTDYQVRLIQLPRSSAATCHPGDPGVAGAVLHTDASGTAAVTVTDALNSGATAAWVIVEGPPPPGQIRGEVYTSDFPAKL